MGQKNKSKSILYKEEYMKLKCVNCGSTINLVNYDGYSPSIFCSCIPIIKRDIIADSKAQEKVFKHMAREVKKLLEKKKKKIVKKR